MGLHITRGPEREDESDRQKGNVHLTCVQRQKGDMTQKSIDDGACT